MGAYFHDIGKMLKPAEKPLRFATPSFTAGTKGIQRGPVVVLKADPFSIPGRATGGAAAACGAGADGASAVSSFSSSFVGSISIVAPRFTANIPTEITERIEKMTNPLEGRSDAVATIPISPRLAT